MEILDIVIGLSFVYLLLSLLCTAINEYVSAILNKRGKELIRGVDQLLGDANVREAFYNHPLISSIYPSRAAVEEREQRLRHALPGYRRVVQLFGWLRRSNRDARRPSYIPARHFALALLSVTDYASRLKAGQEPDDAPPVEPVAPTPGERPGGMRPWLGLRAADASPTPSPALTPATVATPLNLQQVFSALRKNRGSDVSELLLSPEVGALLSSYTVPARVRQQIEAAVAGVDSEVQKLEDSVEVWFNNAMDRVSGAYKRYTQIALVVIGFVVAIASNADTIQIWRMLAANDALREGLARRAVAYVDSVRAGASQDEEPPAGATQTPATDSAAAGAASGGNEAAPADGSAQRTTAESPVSTEDAGARYRLAKAELDSTNLRLGWTRAEALRLGLVTPKTHDWRWTAGIPPLVRTEVRAAEGETAFQWLPWRWNWGADLLSKLIGLLLTGIALSLGAPFWFDTLNKFINIRSAGRAPDEKAKSPEAAGKRLAERATK